MFDYVGEVANAPSAVANGVVWSQNPLQPLAPGVLTPFSFSVLSELASRAWYSYYDRLGFAPTPRTRLLRSYQGRAYMNLSVSAHLEAEQAGVEPLTLRVNGHACPLAVVEKAGLLASFRLGRSRSRIQQQIGHLEKQMAQITQQAAAWFQKTQELRWTQAEVLQVMEEIENVGVDSMAAYFAARHNAERVYNRLALMLAEAMPFPTNLTAIHAASIEIDNLIESTVARSLVALAGTARHHGRVVEWLKAGSYAGWQEALHDTPLVSELQEFLSTYGHRGIGEGEVAQPRWYEQPDAIFQCLSACVQSSSQITTPTPAAGNSQAVLNAVKDKKAAQHALHELRQLQTLQSRALNALAYIWAGTRRWAAAAAREAMADGRLAEAGDVYFYELEEIKEMMTGEWNVSDIADIHAVCAERKAEYSAWQKLYPGEVLLNDSELRAAHPSLPGAGGRVRGTLQAWHNVSSGEGENAPSDGLILAGTTLDSGWALALPFAGGFVAAGGTPLDPVVASARLWQRPAVVGLGLSYAELRQGAQTTVDGDASLVAQ